MMWGHTAQSLPSPASRGLPPFTLSHLTPDPGDPARSQKLLNSSSCTEGDSGKERPEDLASM